MLYVKQQEFSTVFSLTVCCGKYQYTVISLLFRTAYQSSSEYTRLYLYSFLVFAVNISYVGGLEAYVNSFLTLTLNNQWQFSLKTLPVRLKQEYHPKM